MQGSPLDWACMIHTTINLSYACPHFTHVCMCRSPCIETGTWELKQQEFGRSNFSGQFPIARLSYWLLVTRDE